MISVRMPILTRTKSISNMDSLGEDSLSFPTFNMQETERTWVTAQACRTVPDVQQSLNPTINNKAKQHKPNDAC